jgi:hypothetical protein
MILQFLFGGELSGTQVTSETADLEMNETVVSDVGPITTTLNQSVACVTSQASGRELPIQYAEESYGV